LSVDALKYDDTYDKNMGRKEKVKEKFGSIFDRVDAEDKHDEI